MTLGVYWDEIHVGELEPVDAGTREYRFRYLHAERAISISLPLQTEWFTPAQSRPFFEALLPEGTVREQIASALKLAASDSYGLLGALGLDCAGALQIVEGDHVPTQPGVRWLSSPELDALIRNLPTRPLGMDPQDQRRRLSLAGVQRKAVLTRDAARGFGEPLNGMPSTHILKPQWVGGDFPDIAVNEFFCMSLAARCGLSVARVELITANSNPCLVVERFDRRLASGLPERLHQEDLCQALGLTPDFKYQHRGWTNPSYASLARLLEDHSLRPGADRLAAAQAALFSFLVANADAHAKNISLLHQADGVRLSPMYDVVSAAVYPDLTTELALGVGDEFDPEAIGAAQWSGLAYDFRLNPGQFEQLRRSMADTVVTAAAALLAEAREQAWHVPVLDSIMGVIERRITQL